MRQPTIAKTIVQTSRNTDELFMRVFLVCILASTVYGYPYCRSCARDANGRIHRNSAARNEFRRGNPCPSTRQRRGACPGFVIDHVKPLACGGADSPHNMQWQTLTDARKKDRWERRTCGGQ